MGEAAVDRWRLREDRLGESNGERRLGTEQQQGKTPTDGSTMVMAACKWLGEQRRRLDWIDGVVVGSSSDEHGHL